MSDKYPLNGTHYTQEDDRQMMQTPADWPWGNKLPLKRSTKYVEGREDPKIPARVRSGRLYASDVESENWIVWHYDAETNQVATLYNSVDDILADGWVVD